MIGRLAVVLAFAAPATIGAPASSRNGASRHACDSAAGTPQKAAEWSAVGTLLEACSCSVPCTCNFGQGPNRSYCHTVYAYRLKTGSYGGVTLDGLAFGGGEADKGAIGYLD